MKLITILVHFLPFIQFSFKILSTVNAASLIELAENRYSFYIAHEVCFTSVVHSGR